jgi:hypothetical protein
LALSSSPCSCFCWVSQHHGFSLMYPFLPILGQKLSTLVNVWGGFSILMQLLCLVGMECHTWERIGTVLGFIAFPRVAVWWCQSVCIDCSGRRQIPGLRRKVLPWTKMEEEVLMVCHLTAITCFLSSLHIANILGFYIHCCLLIIGGSWNKQNWFGFGDAGGSETFLQWWPLWISMEAYCRVWLW